jgi:peptidoglycan/xylan/chitin deacetylase (PgdA/CDA1 family)
MKMRRNQWLIVTLILLLVILLISCVSCTTQKVSNQGNRPGNQQESQSGDSQGNKQNEPDAQEAAREGEKEYPSESELAAWQANEAGKVMILMYHVIGAAKEGAWAQTTANFRRDLTMLYEQGYSLISLRDFINNNIDVPAGRTPIILTFDDGTTGHFRYLTDEEGNRKIDPECAAGILLDFGKEHPLFGHTATFYVNNDPPFSQKNHWQEKLREAVALGFDIGNHTLTHAMLNKLSAEGVQKELAGIPKLVEETVSDYKVDSLALPYGLSPREYNLAVQGAYEGYTYEHQAVLKVGANPAVSPVVKGFDPTKLPRVLANTEELAKWLTYFQKNPTQRYISDGNPQTIAIPAEKEELLDQSKVGDKILLIWEKNAVETSGEQN